MKKSISFIMALACMMVSAQNINDVLRYSSENLQGTARFQGMGGAFGALGGDLSALNINPAGSAVFNYGQITVSGTNYNRDNDATYFGTTNNRTLNSLELNQLGAVFVFKNTDDNSDWKKFSLAVNYDLVQNFDDAFFVSGNSTQGIDNYFLSFAQGVPFGQLTLRDGEFIEDAYLDIGSSLGFGAQQAFLGYFGGVIDPVAQTDENTAYISNAQYSTVNQQFFQSTSGYNSKITLNMASQFQDVLYLGASLNFHTVEFNKLTRLTERGFNTDSEIQFINFDNFLHTEGNGFSFSLGAIAKLNDVVRLGGSYQSPTWYRLEDDTSQRINSDLADSDINFIDFNVINLFERYTIKTPGKLTGSLGLVFGKEGLLSVDYGYQDMSQAELRPTTDPDFSSENDFIANTLGGVSSVRVGGEYRIEQLSLRAGYRYEQSPYNDGNTIGDLNAYSAGIGYSFGSNRIDFAYSRSEQDFNAQLFDAGLPIPSRIANTLNNVTLGYSFSF
ncbi:outer membrane protein transport protein [Arenibacter sp. GZD96]|uniref:OmpP1/FadL family transporter n=1 Tax=Aurantibrevibacter litoralis TaxID=3106030 RepID=UPI002AFE1948|nr:outer membrane protein transport protein [Arenibacter sp. GZD-96]MEA1785109.1 outer membrane protein transport protein [Arenibacter sp. GZD-96]